MSSIRRLSGVERDDACDTTSLMDMFSDDTSWKLQMRFGIVLSSDCQDGVSGAQALSDQLIKAGVVRAAKTADGWLNSSRATIATIARQVQQYQAVLQDTGRQGYIAAWREMYVAEDKATAMATIRPYVERHAA